MKSNCLVITAKLFLIVLLATIMAGCSHSVAVRPNVSPMAYNFSDKPINAHICLVMHDSISNHKQVVNPKSYVCSAWSYPVEMGPAISSTITQVAKNCFREVEVMNSIPVGKHHFNGILMVDLIDANLDLTFLPGFWSATADCYTEMNLKLTFLDGNNKKVWQSVVGYSKRQTGDSGGACEGGSTAISQALEACLKNISIQLAEKLTNCDQINKACSL